ncbi:hypothetical protein HA402_012752 [Bradysia odoriphaga]|nr:hypothetical protein HA402_012752 [Bradysia odoriphaga]
MISSVVVRLSGCTANEEAITFCVNVTLPATQTKVKYAIAEKIDSLAPNQVFLFTKVNNENIEIQDAILQEMVNKNTVNALILKSSF